MPKVVDYLTEDAPISGQKYALVSIVGPNMPQKTDVWGLKVRGVANTIDKAKEMSGKIMKTDSDYDIYTVEVGKFFPLVVEPSDINDVEYSNDKLNELMKKYLENKELANQEWQDRKQKMVEKAEAQKEMTGEAPEHPFSVIYRIDSNMEYLRNLEEQVRETRESLAKDKSVFSLFTKSQVVESYKYMTKTAKLNDETVEFIKTLASEEELQSEQKSEEVTAEDSVENKENILLTKDKLQTKLDALETEYSKIGNKQDNYLAPLLAKEIASLKLQIEDITKKIAESNLVNEYVNSKYQNSDLNNLFN